MRALLVFVAVIGLPLVALAEPTPDDRKATEVSELVVLARKATEVSGLTVNSSCSAPATDSQWPSAWFDAPTDPKGKRTEESEGTRAFILRLITDVRNGTPDYAHMGGQLASDTRQKLALTRLWIVCRGAFKDIKFLHVSREGYDDFEVDFSNGAIEWEVKPLNSHQVAEHTALRFFYPQPVTKQFEDLLTSLKRGRPNYADLTSESAATLQAQWPDLHKTFETWRGSPYIYFLRRGDDGSYTYLVAYKRDRLIWRIGALDEAGKITGVRYDEGPN
jgi:hypothetical protein